MSTAIVVPTVGESITEVVIGAWLVAEGDQVAIDQPLVALETDKVNVEVPAPVAGIMGKILKGKGETAHIGEILTTVEVGAKQPEAAVPRVMPAAQRILDQAGLPVSAATATGPGGRVLKQDAQAAAHKLSDGQKIPLVFAETPAEVAPPTVAQPVALPPPVIAQAQRADRREELVPMTPLRKRVAQRLVQAQQTAAILTTFNECDMTAAMDLRKKYQEAFVARHGTKLGFMSLFIKACVDALRAFPMVNAQIRGNDIVLQHFYDIGVAVGGGKGLVVPVLRDADKAGLADLEKSLADFGARAKAGTLKLDELLGGTFSISNGGVYGSMLSTPILNPPQSAILGMHNIIDRPVGLNGQVVLRPMMYLALSYDHRLVDGREAVQFLVRVKQCIEAPERLLLDL